MPLDPKLQKIVNQTVNFIEDHNGLLEKQVRKMQEELVKRLLAELIPQMELAPDGTIKNTWKNIKILEELNKTFTRFQTDVGDNTISKFIEGFYKVNLFNNQYYLQLNKSGQAFKKKLFDNVLKGTEKKMMYRLGLTEAGGVRANSWLDGFISDKSVQRTISEYVLKSVGSQIPIKDFSDGLRGMVEGVNENSGIFERYYRQYAYDTYSQYDNAYAEQLATGLDLNAFMYQGGLIKKSRPFCIEHNNKVWTREEAKEWPEWKDPDTGEVPSYIASFPGYDPLVNLGGFNCRHKLSWITNQMAIKLRPELAEVLK